MSGSQRLRSVAAWVCAASSMFVLGGCEGDARDLTEPVEVSRNNLGSLTIVPPAHTLSDIIISPDEDIQFTLTATDTQGQPITISPANRRWQVSNGDIASISENGVLTGKQQGMVDVSVFVGTVSSQVIPVEVSPGTLLSFVGLTTQSALQPCVSQTYTAVGLYSDERERGVQGVSWEVTPANNAAFTISENQSTIELYGRNEGVLVLTAELDGVETVSNLVVDSSLVSISLGENLSVSGNSTLQMKAEGSFTTAQGTQVIDITENVAWVVAEGDSRQSASISSSGDDIGLLRSRAAGNATVSASCGSNPGITGETTVVVTPTIITGNQTDDPIVMNVSDPVLELRVSTGATFSDDEDREVTQEAEWTFVNSRTDIVSLSNTSPTRGQVTAQMSGKKTVDP